MRDFNSAAVVAKESLKSDAPKESKGDYKRLTITLPPQMWDRVIDEMASRKKSGVDTSNGASGVVRDALAKYFENF